MNNVCKTIVQTCFITLFTVFSLQLVAEGATQISGKVTAKRSDSVKVEFKPHKIAGPKIGDLVSFAKVIQGIEVNAGQGEVTKSGGSYAWVAITKGRPGLKMKGIIHATGEPGPVKYTFTTRRSDDADPSYIQPGADIRIELQPGLVFKGMNQRRFRSNHFDIDETGQVFGLIDVERSSGQALTNSRNLLGEHKWVEEAFFDEGGLLNRKIDVIWRDRVISGTASKCIASYAATRLTIPLTINAQEESRDEFFATCKAETPLRDFYKIEPLFNVSFTIFHPNSKDIDREVWEEKFLKALESLSIEFKE